MDGHAGQLLGEDRRDHILHALAEKGSVKVAHLSQLLGCSEATLRRDLQQMEDAGLLRRTHGGALRAHPQASLAERTLGDKIALCAEEKHAIGRAAAKLVAPDDVVALNGGTTTLQVAKALKTVGPLRLITNSLGAATELADQPAIEVTVTGGTLRGSLELHGPHAEQLLNGLFVHTAFIGVDGLTVRHGLTTYNQQEAHTNRVIMSRAERVVVVADHSKIGRVTMALIAPISEIHVVITDTKAPENELFALRAAGIEVIIAS
ncbi:MAG: alkaline phosphatase [Chloroflexi bacterium]|nr:alkaline phosphatase [Chloroflexota bacterium]